MSNEKFLPADSPREPLERTNSARTLNALARNVYAPSNAGGPTNDSQMDLVALSDGLAASCVAACHDKLLERPGRTSGVPLQKGGIGVRQMEWGVPVADTDRAWAGVAQQLTASRNVHGSHS